MGAPTLGGGRQHTILPNFPKNCMKLKEFRPQWEGRPSRPPLDPPLISTCIDLPQYQTSIQFLRQNISFLAIILEAHEKI